MFRRFGEKRAYRASRTGLAAACLVARVIPREWLYRLSDILANAGFYLFRGFRTRSLRNVSMALGKPASGRLLRDIVRRSLRNFFRDFVEIVVALVTPGAVLRSEIPIAGREHLESALAKGNGVIILSAHLGNFLLLGTRLALEGYPVHVLVNQPREGQLGRLMDDYRLKVLQKTIHARPRRDAWRELTAVLRTNQMAIIIADEYRRGSGIHVRFFDRTVLARRGPAVLALRTGAGVIPAVLVRTTGSRLQLVIEPAIELEREQRGKAAIRDNTVLINQWLERTVRAYPDQWNWMNIHWQDAAENVLASGDESIQRVSY